MTIKKQYELNESAWIHLGNGKLHKGKVIDYFDLEHAGYPKDREFYLIEITTEIEPLLEVRNWEQMSQDEFGPIGCYRSLKEDFAAKKVLGKVGVELPLKEDNIDLFDVYDPTPEEVNAAIERAERAKQEMYAVPTKKFNKKRTYNKRPKKNTISN